jgi:hypothetical protein
MAAAGQRCVADRYRTKPDAAAVPTRTSDGLFSSRPLATTAIPHEMPGHPNSSCCHRIAESPSAPVNAPRRGPGRVRVYRLRMCINVALDRHRRLSDRRNAPISCTPADYAVLGLQALDVYFATTEPIASLLQCAGRPLALNQAVPGPAAEAAIPRRTGEYT